MDLWRLKIFRKVVDLNSFSKAAESIHLSQPTVSSHIKDLEDHFRCRLIDRIDKKSVPTKAGELLYQYAGRLLALQDETENAMAEFLGKISGRLVIGGSTIPAGYLLPRVIGEFIQKYPEVNIVLSVGDTQKIITEILSSSLELGIVGARINDKYITQKKLIDDEMCLIVPGNHKWADRKSISLEFLLREPFIIRENGSGTRLSIQKSLAQKGMSIEQFTVTAEIGSTEAVIQGIKNKIGVSILSRIAVAEELKRGALKALEINGLSLKRKFYLTTHKDRTESPLCKEFIRFLEKNLTVLSMNK